MKNNSIGAFAVLFGFVSFGSAISNQPIVSGIFGLCAGALGYMAGWKRSNDD